MTPRTALALGLLAGSLAGRETVLRRMSMELKETEASAAETTEWTTNGTAITRHPRRLSGEPTIAGTRIAVAHVVVLARRFDGDLARVQSEGLPMLALAQIRGAMECYQDHPEEIDAYIEADREARVGLPQAPMGR
jgi:uncharacterized protein (DUF433 family)